VSLKTSQAPLLLSGLLLHPVRHHAHLLHRSPVQTKIVVEEAHASVFHRPSLTLFSPTLLESTGLLNHVNPRMKMRETIYAGEDLRKKGKPLTGRLLVPPFNLENQRNDLLSGKLELYLSWITVTTSPRQVTDGRNLRKVVGRSRFGSFIFTISHMFRNVHLPNILCDTRQLFSYIIVHSRLSYLASQSYCTSPRSFHLQICCNS
jgi:hypothetical protein